MPFWPPFAHEATRVFFGGRGAGVAPTPSEDLLMQFTAGGAAAVTAGTFVPMVQQSASVSFPTGSNMKMWDTSLTGGNVGSPLANGILVDTTGVQFAMTVVSGHTFNSLTVDVAVSSAGGASITIVYSDATTFVATPAGGITPYRTTTVTHTISAALDGKTIDHVNFSSASALYIDNIHLFTTA